MKAKQERRDRLARIAAARPPRKTDRATGELPWWARTKPGEMTATAQSERARMEQSKEAKKVKGAINEV